MRILSWNGAEHWGWRPDDGVDRTLVEVDDDGRIHREIGLDAGGEVVYIAPAVGGTHPYGTFDLQVLAVGALPGEDEFPRAEFEALWLASAERFGARQNRTVT